MFIYLLHAQDCLFDFKLGQQEMNDDIEKAI